MTGLYIFGVLIVLGFVGLIWLRMKWKREASTLARGRATKIESDRVEAAAKIEAREKK